MDIKLPTEWETPKMNAQMAKNESKMLDGNICRMFVTNDSEELIKMYDTAIRRLNKLLEYHQNRIQRKSETPAMKQYQDLLQYGTFMREEKKNEYTYHYYGHQGMIFRVTLSKINGIDTAIAVENITVF